MRVVRGAIFAGGHRDFFRVIEFSVQRNHIHMIVEADGAPGLTSGMLGLEVRLARRLNRSLGRRGRFFADRYHARTLKTPSEVRSALHYVLNNHAHHLSSGRPRGGAAPAAAMDPCSSAIWFDGWNRRIEAMEPWQKELLAQPRPTANATVWLLTTGWRLHGLLILPGRETTDIIIVSADPRPEHRR